jgi:hypothetical protein
MSRTIFAADDKVTARTYQTSDGDAVNPAYCGEHGAAVIRTGTIVDTSNGTATVHFADDESPTENVLFRRMRLAVPETAKGRAAQYIEQLARREQRDLDAMRTTYSGADESADEDDEASDTAPETAPAADAMLEKEALIDALRAGAAYLLSD